MNMKSSVLLCDPSHVNVRDDGFTGELTPRYPEQGLHNISVDPLSLPALRLFCISWPAAPPSFLFSTPEFYIHQDDLLVTYPESASCPFTLQLHWHIRSRGKSLGTKIDLVASVNTSLLGIEPRICLESWLPNCRYDLLVGEDDSVDPRKQSLINGVLCHLGPGGLNYTQMLHPKDQRTEPEVLVRKSEHGLRLSQTMFSQSLEKGVIVRARVCGYLMQVENTVDSALRLLHEFASGEPPLST